MGRSQVHATWCFGDDIASKTRLGALRLTRALPLVDNLRINGIDRMKC